MTFRAIATITSVLLFLLGVGYLFAGATVVGRWDLQATEGVLLVARRIGAIYVGLSVLFFMAKNVSASPARTAMSAGGVAVLSLLVILGVYEFLGGRVGAGIFVSVGIESLLAIGYIIVLIADLRARGAISALRGENDGDQNPG